MVVVMKYAAININFDSLGEAYGFPVGYRDPSFFEVADRFFKFSSRLDFKYSIYIIGKDLEKDENRQRVKQWATEGHEIGNHSWSHPLNLGTLPEAELRSQIARAHQIITEAVGRPPEGFIAPGWCTSERLLRTLIDLGYSYDTSSCPSWLMTLAVAKNLCNHIGSDKWSRIFNRRDLWLHLFGPRAAYDSDGSLFRPCDKMDRKIKVMPLPTNRRRVACWHTPVFVFGWKQHEKILKSCLDQVDAFYYLIHPLDLMDRRDLDPARKIYLERTDVPLEEKKAFLEKSLRIIIASGRKIVTMRELAEKCGVVEHA